MSPHRRTVTSAIIAATFALIAGGTFGACTDAPHEGLPYFRSKELTPEWVSGREASGDAMHRIPAFALTSHRGARVTEGALRGRITLVHFFFAECGRVCPRAVGSISRLLQTMPTDSAFQVLSYTVQPAHDSVAALAAYASHHEITDARWQLLTGPWSDIASLAADGYFVNLRDGSSYGTDDLAHTETLVLIDQRSRIRGVYNATLVLDMEQIVRDVRTLEAEDARPQPAL
jgi:protein SCO1